MSQAVSSLYGIVYGLRASFAGYRPYKVGQVDTIYVDRVHKDLSSMVVRERDGDVKCLNIRLELTDLSREYRYSYEQPLYYADLMS